MSIRLLQDPNKAHELLDDLESVFWVLVYGALKRYLSPNQPSITGLMNMFDEERVDQDNIIIGGQGKANCLWAGRLQHAQFTCASLQGLVHECATWWGMYHRAVDGARDVDIPATKAKIMGTLDLAPRPSYWIGKFAKALAQASEARASEPAGGTSHGATDGSRRLAPHSLRSASLKRSAADAQMLDDDDAVPAVRRSKRLKAAHKR